jgi:hypothetical protein
MAEETGRGVFVVYGRNTRAYREMRKFLQAIGAKEWTFEEASHVAANPFVTNIVVNAIADATAVIVLFTPDELATLYATAPHLISNTDVVEDFRWQPRPNVIFEAGIAFGSRRDRTVIVTVGKDVAGFSDIAGVHVVRLSNRQGKASLRERLLKILGNLPQDLCNDWQDPDISGDFDSCAPRRWRLYDELQELEMALRARSVVAKVKKGKKKWEAFSLFEVLSEVLKTSAANWRFQRPRDFMNVIRNTYGNTIANKSYWWLCVLGFFQFQDTRRWFDSDDSWRESVDYCRLSARGMALIEKLTHLQ